MRKLLVALLSSFALSAGAHAAQVLPTAVTASGSYSGDIAVLTDGVIPPLRTYYASDVTVHDYGSTTFSFAFSGLRQITDVLASVDNNDDYTINFFSGASGVASFFIPAGAGPVTAAEGGMDTFASFSGPDITQLGVSANFFADSATIVSSGGDGAYAVGEVQFFNNAGVPEPATWAMMIGGFGLAGGALRRRQRTSVRYA